MPLERSMSKMQCRCSSQNNRGQGFARAGSGGGSRSRLAGMVTIVLIMVVLIFRRGRNEGRFCGSIDTVPVSVSVCHRPHPAADISLQFFVMHVTTFEGFWQIVGSEAGRCQLPLLIVSIEAEQLVLAVGVAVCDFCRSSRGTAGRRCGGLSCHRCHCSSHDNYLFRKHF